MGDRVLRSPFAYAIFYSDMFIERDSEKYWAVQTKAPICHHQTKRLNVVNYSASSQSFRYSFIHNDVQFITTKSQDLSPFPAAIMYPLSVSFRTFDEARIVAKVLHSEPWTLKHSEVTYRFLADGATEPTLMKVNFVQVYQPSNCRECNVNKSISNEIESTDFLIPWDDDSIGNTLPWNFLKQKEVESVEHFDLKSYSTFSEAHQAAYVLLTSNGVDTSSTKPTLELKTARQYKINRGLEHIFGNDTSRHLKSKLKSFIKSNLSTQQVTKPNTKPIRRTRLKFS